jgi:hypothetical protein
MLRMLLIDRYEEAIDSIRMVLEDTIYKSVLQRPRTPFLVVKRAAHP